MEIKAGDYGPIFQVIDSFVTAHGTAVHDDKHRNDAVVAKLRIAVPLESKSMTLPGDLCDSFN